MTFVAIQPEQKATLKASKQEWLELKGRLLAIGGTTLVIPLWRDDHLPLLIEGGLSFSTVGLELVPGETSGCHRNAARYFLDGEGDIVTGYGLSEDGYWRQHTWVATDHILETTLARTAYFGIALPNVPMPGGSYAERWAVLQL